MKAMNNSNEMVMSNTVNDSSPFRPHKWKEIWWIYILTSIIIYFICLGLSSVVFWLATKKREGKTHQRNNRRSSMLYYRHKRLQYFFRNLLLGEGVYSKILITVNLVCNILYILLGIYRSHAPFAGRECFFNINDPENILEMVLVVELFCFALARFITTSNIVHYWFTLHAIVDVLTLPHIFISAVLGADWIGLRSLRFVWLTQIISVLRFSPFASHNSLDIITLLIYFIIFWLSSSSIIHLLESQGDPWKQFNNGNNNSMPLYAYFIMVTVSTVGYGDFYPVTDLGRIFITFFIIAGLAFFAGILPKLVEVTSCYYRHSQYSFFHITRVPQHVIVCGHITEVTADDFLKDFLHPDRGDQKTHVLFLHPGKPDIALKNILHSYYTRVQYLDGSVLKSSDLHKAKINVSQAVFILANKHTHNPTEEDYANLLRLVSIKNTTKNIPVVIQLLHSFSKIQAYNIPSWNKDKDTALGLNEMKLGLLSQSCLCPGFSTLIANLFYTSDFSAPRVSLKSDNSLLSWKQLYIKGASNEIYCSPFSNFFEGMTFHEAANRCYNELDLVLMAVECSGRLYINPSTTSHPNLSICNGYFIAPNQDQVSIVNNYSPGHSKRGRLTPKIFSMFGSGDYKMEQKSNIVQSVSHPQKHGHQSLEDSRKNAKFQRSVSQLKHLNSEIAFLEIPKEQPPPGTKDHIVLCVFADENSPLIGLHSFLEPLRRKHLHIDAIKPVVIVSDKAFIVKEWTMIQSTPKLYVVVGSPLCQSNLDIAKVSECSVCVILTIPSISALQEKGINDKEAILCNFSIQNSQNLKKTVHIITDLQQESNVQFLDLGDEDEPDEKIYRAQPFACGQAFTATLFDSVTSSVFYSPGILHLVENLIHLSGTHSSCQAVMVPVSNQFWRETFKGFYNAQLKSGNICMGISRVLEEGNSSQRFVITSPDPDFVLEQNDIAYVLKE